MKYEQKFHRGDVVRIAKDLGVTMRHFKADEFAVIKGSYYEQYGGSKEGKPTYTINIKGHGQSSWYDEHQLTLVKKGPNMNFKDYCEKEFAKL